MIDLSAKQLAQVQEILQRYVPDSEVRAFGSRVTGNATQYSDLDLVVVGKEKLPQKTYYRLQEAFQESELSIRVDVLDWHRINGAFREIIKDNYAVIHSPALKTDADAKSVGNSGRGVSASR